MARGLPPLPGQVVLSCVGQQAEQASREHSPTQPGLLHQFLPPGSGPGVPSGREL